MTRKEFCNEISRQTDTPKQKIDVTITYRVLRCAFDMMRTMTIEDVARLIRK